MKIELGTEWSKNLKGKIERFNFEVGILDHKTHRDPVVQSRFEQPQLSSYAGGPVRRAQRKASNQSTSEIFIENMKRLNINLLLRPFQEKSSDIIRFTTEFLKMAVAKGNKKRVENLLQAIVRNPILKQEYGSNKSSTADAKGFDRHLFDTGQMFKAIRARVKRV